MSRPGRPPKSPLDRRILMSISVPARLRQQLADEAAADRRPLSQYVVLLLEDARKAKETTR